MLEKETQVFEKEREHLLENHEGQFVLLHDEEIGGIFESKEDAIRQGYKVYGNDQFLVKKVEKFEEPLSIVSGHLAL